MGRARLLVGEARETKTRIDFGALFPTVRLEREIWAVNEGDAAVELTASALEAPFVFKGAAAVSLAPGERVRWPVEFAPTLSGAFAGELRIEVAGGDLDALRVELSGTAKPIPPGDPACLRVKEPAFAEAVASCSSSRATVGVANVCDVPVTIDGLQLVEGAGEFKIKRRPAFPHALAVGGSFEVDLEFATEQPGRYPLHLALQVGGDSIPVAAEALAVEPSTRFVDPFRGERMPTLDLLIVLDDSPSFASMRERTERQLRTHAVFLKHSLVDVQVAVTTTSVCRDPEHCTAEESKLANGRFLPLDESGPRILSNAQPDFEERLVGLLSAIGQGSERELLIRPAVLAVSEPLRSGHNRGFPRDGAHLAVFVLSDADDRDETPVAELLAAMEQARGVRDSGALSFNGIIPTKLGKATEACGYDSPSAPESTRIRELVQRTGGIFDEVCGEWSRALERYSGCLDCFGRTAFQLSRVPWKPEEKIVVTQGGQVVDRLDGNGEVQWTWSPYWNQVRFEPLAIDLFAEKSISYIACE